MTRLNTQFSVKGISLLNSVMASSSSVQFKKFLFNQVDDIAGMKCPQLSKPEATAARNQNSIGDRTEKKTLGETRLSWGAISPLARRPSSSIPAAAKSDIVIISCIPASLCTSSFILLLILQVRCSVKIHRDLFIHRKHSAV